MKILERVIESMIKEHVDMQFDFILLLLIWRKPVFPRSVIVGNENFRKHCIFCSFCRSCPCELLYTDDLYMLIVWMD